jgi:hypothetical protein
VTKISQLSSIGDSLAIGDQFLIRDIDDAGSPNKSVTVSGITRALADGDATAPALAFAADKNTGIYRAGTDSLAVATNGIGRLFVDADGALTVTRTGLSGNLATFNGQNGLFQINSTRTTGGSYSQIAGTYGGNATDFWRIGSLAFADGSFAIWAGAGAQERLRIDSSGRVGIGTSSPDERLHVKATGTQRVDLAKFELAGQRSLLVQGQWGAMDIGTSNGILQYTSGNLGFRTSASGNANMLLDISGRVGIGSTTVDEHLHIEGIGTQRVKIEATDTSVAGLVMLNANRRYDVQVNGSDLQIYDNTASAERARIDSSGRLLVGTSSARSVGGLTNQVQVEGVNAGTYSQSWVRNVAGTGGATIFLGKSRSGSVGGVTIVNTADQLGGLYFVGADGVDLDTPGASIEAYVDGTPGANDMPGRLVFSTTADGAASPTERMRITNSGRMLVGTASSSGNAKFEVTETRRLSSTAGGSGWLELTDSAAVTSGTLTDIATVSLTNRNTCYFRLEVNAGHTDADGGYSGAVSIREGIITQYGGTPNVLNNAETRNLAGSVNAGVIATAVTTDVVTGTSGATSTLVFRATVTMTGSNSGSTAPRVSYRLSIFSNSGNSVTVASNI